MVLPEQSLDKSLEFQIFPWNTAFATGIDVIDTQHQQLVSILNRLARHFVLQSTSVDEIEAIIRELADYTDYHFKCEEQIWHRHFEGHPMLSAHEQVHHDFFDKIASIKNSKGSLEDFAQDLFGFLTRWLAFHILDNDKRMALATLRMDGGEPIDQALQATDQEMTGELAQLINTVLAMYGELSSNTIALMREKLARDSVEKALYDERMRLAEQSLISSEERYSMLFEAIPDGVLVCEIPSGQIVEFNQVMEELSGRSREQLIQMQIFDLHPKEDRDFHIANLAKFNIMACNTIANGRFESLLVRSDEQHIDVEISVRGPFLIGESFCLVGVFRDIREGKRHQQALEYVAYNDELTGLFNRQGIKRYMNEKIGTSPHSKLILHADIDNFTHINQSYGNEFGDRVLKAFAKQVKVGLSGAHQMARLGGDEFLLIVDTSPADDPLSELISDLMNRLQRPVSVDGSVIRISVSAGIKYCTATDWTNAEVLLRQLAHGLYLAKIKGAAQFHLLDQFEENSERTRNELLNRIEQGLDNNEFELFYQPQVDMLNGHVIGAEALIRWRHPQKGLLSPVHFIPATTNHRVSALIDDWVLQQSLQQIALWHHRFPGLKISCNISAMSIQDSNFSNRLGAMLNEYPQVSPSSLEIEILESSAMLDMSTAIANLEQLKSLGVCSAIDDFGTGYSALAYLRRLPLSWLKLDQSFIADMCNNVNDHAVIEAIIAMAEAFDLSMIAEGVETLEQGTVLINMGCQYGQGYAIARPMPALQFEDWLKQWQPPAVWLEAASPA